MSAPKILIQEIWWFLDASQLRAVTGQKIQLLFECFYDQFTLTYLFLVILITVLHCAVSGKLLLYPNAIFSWNFEILCSVPFDKNTQLTNTSMNKNIHIVSREKAQVSQFHISFIFFFIFHTAIPWQKPDIWINTPWPQLP